MSIYFLPEDDFTFPDPNLADEEGILAVGGNLREETLIDAYSLSLFPWFEPDSPIVWWTPNPRFVLHPENIRIQKSMRSIFNQGKFQFSFNTCFSEVLMNCAAIERKEQDGTWIDERIKTAFTNLHKSGWCHSIEVWRQDKLVGGLYGLLIGNVFFGESMFSLEQNASKAGLIYLCKNHKQLGIRLIDCQVHTEHLEFLGADFMDRTEFLRILENNPKQKHIIKL